MGIQAARMTLMPLTALFQLLLAVLLFIVFLAGCVKAPSPEIGLQELRDQAEERLLQDAKLAFMRADYPEAVLLFHRFVKTHPRSHLTPEAQWWLARSYEQSGNLRLALARYQRLGQSSANPYRQEASLRANQLIKELGIEAVSTRARGLMVQFQDLPGKAAQSLMAQHHLGTGSVMLLDIGCPVQQPSSLAPVEQKTENSKWRNAYGQDLEGVIVDAADSGQLVFLGVSLPCLGLFSKEAERERSQWHEWSFDPTSQRQYLSPYFSLFSSGYQTAMRELLLMFSQLKIAGIVFRDQTPLGPYDGISPIAIKRFESAFDVSLDPVMLFGRGEVVRASQSGSGEFQDLTVPAYSNMFWKWAGWKARERLRVMSELVVLLREANPHLQFGVEFHPESLYAPVYALANFSEDWVETTHASFDFFVTHLPNPSYSETQTKHDKWSPSNSPMFQRDLVERVVEYLDDPQKVWVIRLESPSPERMEFRSNKDPAQLPDLPEGVGELLDVRVLP